MNNGRKIRFILDTGATAVSVGPDPAPEAEGGDRQLQRQGHHGRIFFYQAMYSCLLDCFYFSR